MTQYNLYRPEIGGSSSICLNRVFSKFPNDLQFQIVQELLISEIPKGELKKKYNFGGNNNVRFWMIKFGISKYDVEQIKQHIVITSDSYLL